MTERLILVDENNEDPGERDRTSDYEGCPFEGTCQKLRLCQFEEALRTAARLDSRNKPNSQSKITSEDAITVVLNNLGFQGLSTHDPYPCPRYGLADQIQDSERALNSGRVRLRIMKKKST